MYRSDSFKATPFDSKVCRNLSNLPFGVASSIHSTSRMPDWRHRWAKTCYTKNVEIYSSIITFLGRLFEEEEKSNSYPCQINICTCVICFVQMLLNSPFVCAGLQNYTILEMNHLGDCSLTGFGDDKSTKYTEITEL